MDIDSYPIDPDAEPAPRRPVVPPEPPPAVEPVEPAVPGSRRSTCTGER